MAVQMVERRLGCGKSGIEPYELVRVEAGKLATSLVSKKKGRPRMQDHGRESTTAKVK